jgi:hypothetical protein
MKTWKTRTAAATAVVIGLGLGVAAVASAAPTPAPTPSPATSAPAAVTIDAAVAKQLAYMREEERLARDVYTAIAALYPNNNTQFARITTAEQRHFDAMGVMLTRYGLSDPSAGLAAGTYADPALTKLYATLMTQAKVSLIEAYKVGVAIEETDIADLKTSLGQNAPSDVKAVYTNLQNGSNSHLAAFTALRDGKTIGVGAGYGRGPGNATAAPGTGTPGAGTGAGYGQGRRGGANGTATPGTGTPGTGTGRNANVDCPLR